MSDVVYERASARRVGVGVSCVTGDACGRRVGTTTFVRSFVRSRGGVGVRAFDAMRCARRGGVHCDLILNVGTAFKLRERMDGWIRIRSCRLWSVRTY